MSAANAILHSTHHKRRARIRLSRAQETIFGVLLVIHALAHAIVGVWASAQFSSWAIVPLWEFATVGFLVAGFGATGTRLLRSMWREMTVFAAFASTMLLFAVPAQVFAIGFGLNLGLGAFAANSHLAPDYSQTQKNRYPRIRIAGIVMVMLFVAYAGLVIALRPWTTRWGTDSSEASAVLPGDREMVSPRYSIGELRPKLSDVALTPLSVFVFEPAHFVMQRRMLVGIKQRAERPLP